MLTTINKKSAQYSFRDSNEVQEVETLTFIFLYCRVSTLNPIVGIVCTASSLSFCNLYRIVVFPALSNPRIKIRTSFEPKRLSKILLMRIPMISGGLSFTDFHRVLQRDSLLVRPSRLGTAMDNETP